jgi:threonine synthase
VQNALKEGMPSLIERYRDRLPVSDSTPVVSLGEGSTPLLRARRVSERLGADVYLKWEGANPTGSFKDRGMTVAISKALEQGAGAVICASTGNTAASAAAYAARAGMVAVVLQSAGAVASAKLAQARALGARVLEVRGSFDEALDAARVLADRGTHVLVNSLNPYRLEGQKTAAFEIVEELGAAPDVLALPYGGGGNLCAYANGFAEAGAGMPRLVAGEAAQRRTTVASAIRIAEPVHAAAAIEAVRASNGAVVSLTDDEILDAWRELALDEGVFCEPSSAAGLAAVARDHRERGSRISLQQSVASVVCVLTGHGLKDAETASQLSPAPVSVEADPDAIAEAAG